MPKLQRPIPESDQSIVRPIAVSLIQDIMINKLLLSRDIRIQYPGYTNTSGQTHKWLSHVRDTDRLPTSDRMHVDVTENYVSDWMPQNVTNKVEHIPLFLNRELDVEIRPIYASMEMKINLQYRAKNKTDARKWYDYMMLKVPNREDVTYHTLNYSYSLPASYIEILKEIHRLTEIKGAIGDDFNDFFTKWVNPKWTILTDQTGKNTLGAFAESQIKCLGFFDHGNEPDFGSRPDETDTWLVEMPYVLRYEKPKDIYFSYPIVIHNSVLSSKYRNTTKYEIVEDLPQTRTWSMAHMKQMESLENPLLSNHAFPGKHFPVFDDWMPRMVPDRTKRVFTTLVLIPDPDSDDPLQLMNLRDLEHPQYNMCFNKHMLDFLNTEHQYVHEYRNSAINICLYKGRLWMDEWVNMSKDLNIKSVKKLDIKSIYHVRLSLVSDLTILTESARNRLRHHPGFFEVLLNYVIPDKHPVPTFKVIREWIGKPGKWINGIWYENEWVEYVAQSEFDRIIEYIKLKYHNKFTLGWNNDGVGLSYMKTVQKTILNALYR